MADGGLNLGRGLKNHDEHESVHVQILDRLEKWRERDFSVTTPHWSVLSLSLWRAHVLSHSKNHITRTSP